jgi:hypothetical protein
MKLARPMSLWLLFSLVSLLLLPTLSFAKSSNPEPVAHPTASGSGIQWMTVGDHDRVELIVVAPNGAIYHKEFALGSVPSFRLQDLGGRITDGSYTYELRVVPRISDEVKKQLAAARAADDDDAIARIQSAAGIGATPVVQSGNLRVINGAFVSPDIEEPPAASEPKALSTAPASGSTSSLSLPRVIKPLDNVIADDQIVQGSLCVGLDCVNNESFGFDTIRLKENNTRIDFQDTSTSAGFPTHDWQLTANDSASGGAEKFSIEDLTAATVPFTVTGSSPTNSLFVASTGKVGFRTNVPALDLHISTTDTPAIRQEQTSGGGFTAQTWDIGANEANWFVRDVTSGSRLPLRIRPGAPTSSIDINATGNVGIGTATASDRLRVAGGNVVVDNAKAYSGLTSTGSAATIAEIRADNAVILGDIFNVAGGSLILTTGGSSTGRLNITSTGNIGIGGVAAPTNPLQHSSGAFLSAGGVWTNASSRDFKQGIKDLSADDAMSALEGLKPVTYAYKVDPSEHHVGFIAEDVPDLVATKDRKSLSPMDVVAVLTKVVQQQQTTIDELKARLGQLEKKQ